MLNISMNAAETPPVSIWLSRGGGAERILLTLLSLVAGLAVGGCEVGPDYQPPELEVAPFHNVHDSSLGKSKRSTSIDMWWTGFDDPILNALVERALEDNLNLATASSRVQQARAILQGTEAQLLPTVDLSGTATALDQSIASQIGKVASAALPNYSRHQNIYTLGALASWEIDLFGGQQRRAEFAAAEVQIAEANSLGARVSVAADLAGAYFIMKDARERFSLALTYVDATKHLLALARERRSRGKSSDRDVAQAEAMLAQAQTTLSPLRTTIDSQNNRIAVLIGVQPGAFQVPPTKGAGTGDRPSLPRGDQPVDLLRRRPDVIAAERRVAATSANIGAAIADYYPKISITGALGLDSLGASHFFTGGAFQALGTGALRWRLFDFGKVDAEVKQATGAHAEALASFRQTILLAAEEIEDAFKSYSEIEIRSRQLREEVRALSRALDLSRITYRTGSATLSEVLELQRQVINAQSELIASRTDAARAVVRIFRTIGGGWSA